MKLIRHPVAGLLMFATLVTLVIFIYDEGVDKAYDVTPDDLSLDSRGFHIAERLNNLTIVSGMKDIIKPFEEGSVSVSQGEQAGGLFESLKIFSGGVIKLIVGIIITPYQIFGIITDYFKIPPIISIGIFAIVNVYIGFIILSAFFRAEV